METKKSLTPKRGGVTKACLFCGEVDVDEDVNGKLLSKAGITAHYFCMLFSSGLSQNGQSEKQGLLGFLPADITKEVRRGVRLRCSFCKKNGATIGCVQKNCKKNFHLGCGRVNGAFHLYYDTFSSYCAEHRPQQKVPPDDDPNAKCAMCIDEVKTAPCSESLRAPCCQKKWYHRTCIQNYSKSAGLYFFKCPLCNNKEEFQKEMMAFGIYIPDQDASWEMEPNAYQELLERYQNCDAKICRCAEGRKYDEEGSKWEILLCNACGSQGSHAACSYLTKHRKKNLCPCCFYIEMKANALASPKSQAFKELQSQCETSPEHTKQNASEYPGPSTNIMKRKLSLKTSDAKRHRLSLGTKCHSSATKHSKKPRLSLDPKPSSTVTKEPMSKKMLVSAPNDTNKKKKSKTVSNVKDNVKGSKIKNCQGSTFMDRYLKYKLSSSPSSSGESSVEETSGNTSILLSYLDKNQLMSAYDLKKLKKKQRNSQEGLQKKKRKRNETKVCQSEPRSDISPKAGHGHSQGRKKRLSDEKLQNTLDSWLNGPKTDKAKTVSTQTLQYVNGEVVDISAKNKDISSKNKEKQDKKPMVIEWQGKQLFLRPLKVCLGSRTLDKKRPRPKNLDIDMVDEKGNPEWEAELDVLSNIETDVRVTRNMINSLDQLTTKSSAGNTRTKSKLSTPVRSTKACDEKDHDVLSPSKLLSSCKKEEVVSSLDKVSPCKKETIIRVGVPDEYYQRLQGSTVSCTDVGQELPPLEVVTSLKKRDPVKGMERLAPSKEDLIHGKNESTCIDSTSKNLRLRKCSTLTSADSISVSQMESPVKESFHRNKKSTRFDLPSKNPELVKYLAMTSPKSPSSRSESPFKEGSKSIDSPSKNLRLRKFSTMTTADTPSPQRESIPFKHDTLNGSYTCILPTRIEKKPDSPRMSYTSTTTHSAMGINKGELVHQRLAERQELSINQEYDINYVQEHSPNMVTGVSMFTYSLAKGSVSPSGNTQCSSLPTHSPDKSPHARKVLYPKVLGSNSPSNWNGDWKINVPGLDDSEANENMHPAEPLL